MPQASPQSFPLLCQKRYVSGRCRRARLSTSTNCGSLCLTKSPSFSPPPQARWDLSQQCKPKCVCVWVWTNALLRLISLWCRLSHEGIQWDRFLSKPRCAPYLQAASPRRGRVFLETWCQRVSCLGLTHVN